MMVGSLISLVGISYSLITLYRRGGGSIRPVEGVEIQDKAGDASKRSSVASIASVASQGVASTHPLYLLRVPFFFFLVYFTAYIYLFAYRLVGYQNFDSYLDGFKDWASCVFTNYDGTDDWKSVCGDHAYDQMPYNNMFAYAIVPSLLPVLFGIIFLLGRQNFYEFSLLSNNGSSAMKLAIEVPPMKSPVKNVTVQPIEVVASPIHKKGGSGKIHPV